jgi:hypothetical protein
MRTWRVRIACWITKTKNTHTLRICNTYCFSTVTVVAGKCRDVTGLLALPDLSSSHLVALHPYSFRFVIELRQKRTT